MDSRNVQVAALRRRIEELEDRLARARRHNWDILPPDNIIAAINYLYVRAYGTRRHEVYELTEGGTLPLPQRMLSRGDLVKHDGAFNDLIDLQRFLDALGRRILDGSDWRELVVWEAVFSRRAGGNLATLAELAEALAGLEPDAEGRISVAEVVEALGWNPEDRSNTTRAGNLLRRAVGLEPVRFYRGGKRHSGYTWDHERVVKFIARYSPEKGCQVVQNEVFSQVKGHK